MSKVVVLGANSFSGQDFVDLLLDDPAYTVVGVSRSPERSSKGTPDSCTRMPGACPTIRIRATGRNQTTGLG